MSSPLRFLDGHNDSVEKLYYAGSQGVVEFLKGKPNDHIDLPRMKQVHFAGGFFAVFVPNKTKGNSHKTRTIPPLPYTYAQQYTATAMSLLQKVEAQSNGDFSIVKSIPELSTCLEKGSVAAIMHFEGAEAIAEDLSNLQEYYDAGLRSVGLAWSRPNVFAEGVPFSASKGEPLEFPHSPDTGPGLTRAGKELVRACNDMGIVVDLAHLNEKGFWDVATLSSKPLVVTHAGVHTICPSPRNLTDKQIDAVGKSRGIIGIYFVVSGLHSEGQKALDVSLSLIVEHILHVIKRIGVEHVGLGSDFDGATMPTALEDVTRLPLLVRELKKAGLNDEDIRKITYKNWLRVLEETWVA